MNVQSNDNLGKRQDRAEQDGDKPAPSTAIQSSAEVSSGAASSPAVPSGAASAAAAPSVAAQTDLTQAYVPYVAPDDASEDGKQANSILQLKLQSISARDLWQSLRQGWRDFVRCPLIGLYFGFCFCVMGNLLWWALETMPEYALAMAAGFMLMGPFICLGMYYASKKLEQGEKPLFTESLFAWTPTIGALSLFIGVLLVLEMLWARASVVVFAVAFEGSFESGHTLEQLMRPENHMFLLIYLAVGAVFAGLIYAFSVISMPMILDQRCDAVSAALTSFRACVQNPTTMLLWGFIITLFVGFAMLPHFLGLIMVSPIVGHASWHVYRHIVKTSI